MAQKKKMELISQVQILAEIVCEYFAVMSLDGISNFSSNPRQGCLHYTLY